MYGKPLFEEDRPSLKGHGEDPEAVTADFPNKDLFNAQKIRGIITCWECYKPCVVYAKGKLTLQEKNALTAVDIIVCILVGVLRSHLHQTSNPWWYGETYISVSPSIPESGWATRFDFGLIV